MIRLDYKSGTPISDQIVNGFIRLKALGLVSEGEQLPSVRAMAMQLSVNPNTVQKAYHILESHGIIYSVQGKGSFISGDQAAENAIMRSAKKGFETAVLKARELGLQSDDLIEIVKREYEEANADD